MESGSKYINFIKLDRPKLKTFVYAVVTKDDGWVLGEIKFYPQWRRYIFMPEGGAVFDSSCLLEIKDFIDKLMKDRKEK